MLPFTSLDAATTPGPGAVKDLEGVYGQHTMVVSASGLATGYFSVGLEGSHDGVAWADIGGGVSWGNNETTPVKIGFHTLRGVRYVRANLKAFSGGASPTVTATIASS